MPLSAKEKETKHWLTVAKSGLKAGRKLVLSPNLSTQASFSAQQSAEKEL
jgi:hypothetical protein